MPIQSLYVLISSGMIMLGLAACYRETQNNRALRTIEFFFYLKFKNS